MDGWTANRQLALQVTPLICKLARTNRDVLNNSDCADLGPVKCVASTRGLVVNCGQVRVDSQARMRVRIETLKLRMVSVAARFAANDRLG